MPLCLYCFRCNDCCFPPQLASGVITAHSLSESATVLGRLLWDAGVRETVDVGMREYRAPSSTVGVLTPLEELTVKITPACAPKNSLFFVVIESDTHTRSLKIESDVDLATAPPETISLVVANAGIDLQALPNPRISIFDIDPSANTVHFRNTEIDQKAPDSVRAQ